MSIARLTVEGVTAMAPEIRAGARAIVGHLGNEAAEVEAGAAMMSEVSAFTTGSRQVFVHSGEPIVTDMSKAGPLTFLRSKAPESLTWPKLPSVSIEGNSLVMNEAGRVGYKLNPSNPLHIPDLVGPQSTRPHPFWNKIAQATDGRFGRYPFRTATDIDAPVANLTNEGRIDSLLFPPKASKAQISETMASASNAERIFIENEAGEAAHIVTKMSAGFQSKMVEVEAASVQEMMGYALKGSHDWIKGNQGNRYTRFLQDWNGNFTNADRTFLSKMFSGEKILARQLPYGCLLYTSPSPRD